MGKKSLIEDKRKSEILLVGQNGRLQPCGCEVSFGDFKKIIQQAENFC